MHHGGCRRRSVRTSACWPTFRFCGRWRRRRERKGPRNNLFGPTVNYAEKMESHGILGQVQLSDGTHSLLTTGASARWMNAASTSKVLPESGQDQHRRGTAGPEEVDVAAAEGQCFMCLSFPLLYHCAPRQSFCSGLLCTSEEGHRVLMGGPQTWSARFDRLAARYWRDHPATME